MTRPEGNGPTDPCHPPTPRWTASTRVRRYSRAQQELHWLTAALTAAALPIAWVMTASPDGKPGVEDLYNIHKTLGLFIFAAIVLRLFFRWRNGAPELPKRLGRIERVLAHSTHGLLYLTFFVMCVSGYVLSAASEYPTLFLDFIPFPALPRYEPLRKAGMTVHLAGQWFVYALIGLHVLGVLFHLAVRRDGLLDRMLPEQTHSPLD